MIQMFSADKSQSDLQRLRPPVAPK